MTQSPETQRQICIRYSFAACLAAILAGIALSNAGLLMQGVFQNPLVSSIYIGVSNGASLARLWQLYLVPILFLNLGNLFTACICFH